MPVCEASADRDCTALAYSHMSAHTILCGDLASGSQLCISGHGTIDQLQSTEWTAGWVVHT
eukprot:1146308-Pelagomonas_calceolata.AAC.7